MVDIAQDCDYYPRSVVDPLIITITIHGSKAIINHQCADSLYRPFTTCQTRWGQAHLLLIQAWHREAKASADATRTARLRKAGLF